MRLELDLVQVWGARGSFRTGQLSYAGKSMSRVSRCGVAHDMFGNGLVWVAGETDVIQQCKRRLGPDVTI